MSIDCEDYDYAIVDGVKKAIAPCGAIANSLFSGELLLVFLSSM